MNYQTRNRKTGISHPLRIDEVDIPGCRGRIVMTFCPEKKQVYGPHAVASFLVYGCLCLEFVTGAERSLMRLL